MKTATLMLVAALAVAPATAAGDAGPTAGADIDPAVTRLVAELRQSVDASPESAAAHADLAIAYEANALWQQAREAYAEALRLDPGNPDWRLHHAIALRQSGDFAASVAELERLIELAPDHAPGLQRLGSAQLENGDTTAARATFMRLIQLDHQLAEGHAGLGDALLREGDPPLAIRQLEAALSLDNTYASAHYLLGQAYRAAGRLDDARRHLAFGQDATPRFLPDALSERLASYAVNLTARLDQASAQLSRRQPDRAIATLQSVRSDHPENVTVLNNLAIAHMHRGDMASARSELDRALAINPDKFSTYLNLAALSQRMNQPVEALRWSDEAVARAPGVARVHVNRAGALLRLGRLDQAIESFEAALAADFREQEPYLALANLELRRDNAEASAGYSSRSLELWPDLVPAHFLQFHARLELSDLEQARSALDAATLLAPDHPNLGELERLYREAVEGSE